MKSNTRLDVMARRDQRRDLLDRELGRMLALLKTRPDVRRVLLFGSVSRDRTGSRSDLDLVIIQDTAARFMDRLKDFYGYLVPRVETDILVYSPREWEALKKERNFVRRLDEEGVVIYDATASS